MEQFISLVIFSLPGLITYFWLQTFGVNPVVKHTTTEMVGLIALLWAPTTFLTLIFYDTLFYIFDSIFRHFNIDLSFLNLKLVVNLSDLNLLSTNLVFLFYYLVLSIIFSFLAAYVWSIYLFKPFLDLINKARSKRDIVNLSIEPTVWESFFFKLEKDNKEKEDEEKDRKGQLLVEIYKIDKPEDRICGPVIRMSRPFEMEKSVIIDSSKGWDEAHKHYNYSIKKTYVDTKSGLIINELEPQNPEKKVVIS